MAAIALRPPTIICQTATATSADSEVLFRLRKDIMRGVKSTVTYDALNLTDQDIVFPIQVEVDFSQPTTIREIANQHRRFLATSYELNSEVEMLNDPA